MEQQLPVTGAWRPGDPEGRRKFLTFASERPFALDGGEVLTEVTIAYETWGTLAEDASNAVLVCHAWTGDSHAAGRAGPGHPTEGWWDAMIGPGRPIDTDRWFVVCANVLGGCQGSTGPASVGPDGHPYGPRFPVITIRDMVRVQARLQAHLGVERWASVVGGSMGGMQVLEWAATYPRRVASIVPIATCLHSTAQQIAWGMIGRRAVRLDPRWNDGEYYDAAPGEGPHEGLAVARQVAQVTFRSDNVFSERFGRDLAERSGGDGFGLWEEFQVETYLRYHGEKLAKRFDANSYLVISKAMDLHDLARGRSSLEQAIRGFEGPCLSVGVSSDMLYPAYQQAEIARLIKDGGGDIEYHIVDSPQGHDGFLLESAFLGPLISSTLEKAAERG